METRRRRGARTRTILWALRLMLAGTVIAPAAEMPNLSGDWQLNRDQSDDPEKVMKEARSSGGSGYSGGGMGRGGGRHGGGGFGGGGGRSGSGRSDSGDSSGGASGGSAALQTLRITHQEPSLAITDAAGRERVLYTDGRKTQEERSHGGTTAVTASWKDGHLEVVAKPENGGKIVETYAVSADHTQLTVTTRVDNSRGGSFTIRRVYDAVQPGAPKPTPPSRRAPPTPPPQEDDGLDQSV